MQCEVVKNNWTIAELRRELLIWTGVDIGRSQLYEWLPYALIKHRGIYSDRDRVKLLKFGEFKTTVSRLEDACILLRSDLDANPNHYPQEDY